MNFSENPKNIFQKNFSDNISLSVDFIRKKFFYPENIKIYRDSIKNFSQNENFVVFECVHRLLQKGYLPDDIEIEKSWKIGHDDKSGRADICVSFNKKTLFIIECKTFGAEFKKEFKNLIQDGGQLFSYRQQEISCQWLVLYASDFANDEIIFESKSVSCHEEIYKNASTVKDFFQIWSEKFQKQTADDVIFHDETVAYKIGVKPLRKKNLVEFKNTGIVNLYEEILRHNSVTNKQNAFDALLELFICKLADESQKNLDDEVDFQFKFGSDTYEIFIDRLQKLYHQGMEKFMHIPTTYTPLSIVENLLQQNNGANRKNLENLFKEEFNKLKFYTPNIFNFIKVLNREIFYMNGKIVREVVDEFKNFKIIGAKNLQTLGDLFEQLLDKGFKQDEGQFFTPIPITRFIWESLPLEKIISAEKNFEIPKIIDYACGAGHFLTQGFEAINNFFTKKNISPPIFWEDEKLFGVEKNDRLSTVSKISLFMHGANKGKIKFGDGLENYPDEGIIAESFDILVSNPPYAIKDFKQYLEIKNKFETLEKISLTGKEIETLFVERISQLLKPGGIAAVILPSSILNKDGGSFVTAREKILQNFYIRAIAEFGSKTFGATGTKTNILFLEKISNPPQKFKLYEDTVNIIFSNNFTSEWSDEEIFSAWLKKNNLEKKIYEKFLSREKSFFEWKNDEYFGEYFTEYVGRTPKVRTFLEKYGDGIIVHTKNAENNYCTDFIPELEKFNEKFYDFAQEIEREKIQYFAQTYNQTTLIISAPDDNAEQKKFLGYDWSNRKGDEGIKILSKGLMFKLTAAVRKSFYGEQVTIPDAQNYFYYLNLADMIDFSGANFTKIIKLTKKVEFKSEYPIAKLSEVCTEILAGGDVPKEKFSKEITEEYKIPIFTNGTNENALYGYTNVARINKDSLTISARGSIGFCEIRKAPFYPAIRLIVATPNEEKILLEYLKISVSNSQIYSGGGIIKQLTVPMANNIEIPVPPIDEQKKIVAEFSAVDDEIKLQEKIILDSDGEIKEKFSEMFLTKDFPREKLRNIVYAKGGDTFQKNFQGSKNISDIPFYKVSDMNTEGNEKFMKVANNYVEEKILTNEIKATIFEKNTIIFPKIGMAIGTNKKRILSRRAAIDNNIMAIWSKTENLNLEYLFGFFNFCINLSEIANNANPPSISATNFYKILIPMPPKEKQEKFAEYVCEVEDKKITAQKKIDELKLLRENLVEKYFR